MGKSTKENAMREHEDAICNNPDTLCADCASCGAEDAA